MLRSELIERVAELHPHLRYSDVERVVETIFTSIGEALARGGRIEIRGFGSFTIKHREAHRTEPANRRHSRSLAQGHPLLQDGQASAREAQRPKLAVPIALTGKDLH